MQCFNARVIPGARGFTWVDLGKDRLNDEESVIIQFSPGRKSSRREALQSVITKIKDGDTDWLNYEHDRWRIDLDGLRIFFSCLRSYTWLKGVMDIEPDIEQEARVVFGREQHEYRIDFVIERRQAEMAYPKKIFLSHKGKNKNIVRNFNETLRLLGFDTWLDEDAMPSGTALERGIMQGMKDACAVVFFITPDFEDENYLATEVEYAIAEKRDKGDRFSIIILVLTDESGTRGQVPSLLRRFVWKEPTTQLEGLREILKALPVKIGPVVWNDIPNSKG